MILTEGLTRITIMNDSVIVEHLEFDGYVLPALQKIGDLLENKATVIAKVTLTGRPTVKVNKSKTVSKPTKKEKKGSIYDTKMVEKKSSVKKTHKEKKQKQSKSTTRRQSDEWLENPKKKVKKILIESETENLEEEKLDVGDSETEELVLTPKMIVESPVEMEPVATIKPRQNIKNHKKENLASLKPQQVHEEITIEESDNDKSIEFLTKKVEPEKEMEEVVKPLAKPKMQVEPSAPSVATNEKLDKILDFVAEELEEVSSPIVFEKKIDGELEQDVESEAKIDHIAVSTVNPQEEPNAVEIAENIEKEDVIELASPSMDNNAEVVLKKSVQVPDVPKVDQSDAPSRVSIQEHEKSVIDEESPVDAKKNEQTELDELEKLEKEQEKRVNAVLKKENKKKEKEKENSGTNTKKEKKEKKNETEKEVKKSNTSKKSAQKEKKKALDFGNDLSSKLSELRQTYENKKGKRKQGVKGEKPAAEKEMLPSLSASSWSSSRDPEPELESRKLKRNVNLFQ